MPDLEQRLGARIKQIRKAARQTQRQLAEKAGLSVEYISRLERGVAQPSLKTFQAIAGALNVTEKDFFDFNGPILFRNRQQEGIQKRKYIEEIASGSQGPVDTLQSGERIGGRIALARRPGEQQKIK